MTIKKHYPYILIVLSLVGILASSVLMNDTLKIIQNPEVELPCNINPLLSCTAVATKWQSHVFGFPNPILGIISFSLLFGVALALIYHVIPEDPAFPRPYKKRKYFWILVNYGALASFVFVVWFFYQSVYNIGNLCLYCMVVWVVTWPIFLYTTVWNQRESNFSFCQKCFNFISKYHLQILVSGYLVAILLILFKFQDFFLS